MRSSKRSKLLLLALLDVAGAGRLHLVTTTRAGVVDPGTGELQLEKLSLPKTKSDACAWKFVNGTVGQVSTSFYMNSSKFIVAQQVCENQSTILSTNLLVISPAGAMARVSDHPQSGQISLTALAEQADGGASKVGAQLHVAWDSVCNVIVTVSNTTTSGYPRMTTFQRVEISEYDGEVRSLPMAANATETDDGCPHGCWKRVPGGASGLAAARDWGAWRSAHYTGERPEEAACTDCVLYVIESWWSDFEPSQVDRRRLVGRGVHNGSVVANVSEPTRLQTMSWLPPNATQRQKGWPGAFFGLGECCELRGCPTECEGHGGELSIVTFTPGDYAPRVILPLERTRASTDSLAIRMGVAVDQFYPVHQDRAGNHSARGIESARGVGDEATDEEGQVEKEQVEEQLLAPRITVWVGGALRSFRITYASFDRYAIPTLVPLATSARVHLEAEEEAVMMAYTYF